MKESWFLFNILEFGVSWGVKYGFIGAGVSGWLLAIIFVISLIVKLYEAMPEQPIPPPRKLGPLDFPQSHKSDNSLF